MLKNFKVKMVSKDVSGACKFIEKEILALRFPVNFLNFKNQHDLTPRIHVLHKITIALKFMSYINQKLQPSYQTALNLHKLKICGRSARGRAEQLTPW